MAQTTNHIFMVRPANFGFNAQTAESNVFQHTIDLKPEEIQQKVLAEFDTMVQSLINAGITVNVYEDTEIPIKPDAIFPNNWVSIQEDKTMILYPMFAENRRLEMNPEIIKSIQDKYMINHIIDLRIYEKENMYLEGTGSMVLDHNHKRAYACISDRTHKYLFAKLCEKLNYKAISFEAFDENKHPIYHTNVMMCIGNGFIAICLEAIKEDDKERVMSVLKSSRLEIVDLSFDQIKHFAGNMLELQDKEGNSVIVLSQNAYNSLNEDQIQTLSNYGKLLPIALPTIETVSGGSARCMIAEIY